MNDYLKVLSTKHEVAGNKISIYKALFTIIFACSYSKSIICVLQSHGFLSQNSYQVIASSS